MAGFPGTRAKLAVVTEVRRYEASDRGAVLALASRLTIGVAPWRDAEAVSAAVRGWVEAAVDQADDPSRAVFVAVDGGVVSGLVSVSESRHFAGDTDAYVGELVVAAEAEGHGVGRALMSAAEQWGRDRKLGHLTLETGAANHGARAFYRSLGYAEEDVRLTKAL